MSYAAEAAAIRHRWNAEWGNTTPTAYENAAYSPVTGQAWVRLAVLNAQAFQADIADSPRYRHPGVITVQIFTPHASGDGLARELGDQAAAVFRGQSFGGVVIRNTSVIPQGSDGTWYQVNMIAEFYRDTTF